MSATSSATGQHGHQVSVRGAYKRYGKVQALSDVCFDVEPGRFLVLLGPSGSGKSTLVRSLAGVERLDQGVISLSGHMVSDGRRHLPPERRDLAMVFQDYALWPHLTVSKNVGYALKRRRLPPAEHRSRLNEALDRVGLSKHAERYPYELSGGEQQRVALARAVVAEPGLLLFDEPLSNLDADLRERLRVEISTLTRDCGASAVYITHDQSEAFALADSIGVLDRGELVQLGTPEEIYRLPATPFVARFTGVSGDVAGVVTAADERGLVTLRVANDVVRARPMSLLAPGDEVRLLVRPAATEVRSWDGAHVGGGQDSVLSATVLDVAYRGRGYDHVVVTDAGTFSSVYSTRAQTRGDRVQLLLDADGCLAYHSRTPGFGDEPDLTAVTLRPSASAPELAGSIASRRKP